MLRLASDADVHGDVPLVPKLRLESHAGKLCFLSGIGLEAELLDLRSQAELGNEGS